MGSKREHARHSRNAWALQDERRQGGHVIPDTLDGWTLEKIHEIAAAGVTENDLFDFKADLQPPEHQRKTVAAFANSDGGFLVFGVTNDRRVEGVANTELARDFGSKLGEDLSPSVEFRFGVRPHVLPSGRFLYVAHVPKSPRAPHAVYVNGAWTFLKRTAAGSNEPMTYEEIRLAFQDTENRRTKLALLSSELSAIGFIAERVLREVPDTKEPGNQIDRVVSDWAWTTRYPTVVLDTILGDAFALVARKEDLWVTLTALRDNLRRSNVIAETYSDYGFIRSTADPQQRLKLYKQMRLLASSIVGECHQAKNIVDATLAGNA